MELTITFLILFLPVIGMFFWVRGFQNRSELHPGLARFNPKYWIPVWRTRSWYTQTGYRQTIIGTILVVAGSLIGLVFYLSRIL